MKNTEYVTLCLHLHSLFYLHFRQPRRRKQINYLKQIANGINHYPSVFSVILHINQKNKLNQLTHDDAKHRNLQDFVDVSRPFTQVFMHFRHRAQQNDGSFLIVGVVHSCYLLVDE